MGSRVKTKPKDKAPRERREKGSGSLVERETGYYGRYLATVDGERVRVTRALGTRNKAAAERKLARLIANDDTDRASVERVETFAEAAERVHAQRVDEEIKSAPDDLARVRRYALPVIGRTAVTAIEPHDVNAVLDHAKAEGLGHQTVVHLRNNLRAVFKSLRREGVIPINPVDDAEMPGFPTRRKRVRAVLDDLELAAYLAYVPPKTARGRVHVLERQVLTVVSRCFGGVRTGDLNSLDWDAFETEDGRFGSGWAPRAKTESPQLLEVPQVLRPVLRRWWEMQGCPAAGPVFPVRRGKRAGEAKGKMTYALAFRRDLQAAFTQALERRVKGVPKPGSKRWRELFERTPHTLPVDFHSWRRAYCQALKDADVNVQQAIALSGHKSIEVHLRYTADPNKAAAVPPKALPAALIIDIDPDDEDPDDDDPDDDDGEQGPQNRDPSLGSLPGSGGVSVASGPGGCHQSSTFSTSLLPSCDSQAGSRGFKSRFPLRKPPEKSGGFRLSGAGQGGASGVIGIPKIPILIEPGSVRVLVVCPELAAARLVERLIEAHGPPGCAVVVEGEAETDREVG